MAKSNRTSVRSNPLDPFDDRVDTLFGELELAVKWTRPSILLAVYKSEFVQADAERLLNARLAPIGIKVVRVFVNENQFDIPLQLIKQSDLAKTVFFIYGLKWGGGRSGRNAYRALNIRREYLVDHRIRAVFWLTEDEAAELPFRAPDFWAFRHQVIEFIDTPPILYSAGIDGSSPAKIFSPAPKDAGKGNDVEHVPVDTFSGGVEAILALLELGNSHWLKGEFAKASEIISSAANLSRAISSDLQFRALIGLGVLKCDAGLLPESISVFQRASRVDRQSFIPWLYLSTLYAKLGFARRSLLAARKASELNPRSADAWLALGNLYAERDNFSEAVAAYQVSLNLVMDNAQAWASLGWIYFRAGNLAIAIAAYEKSAKLEPESGETLGMLSLLYRDSGDLKKARKTARIAVKKAPGLAQNWQTYGSILAAETCYEDAIAAFSQGMAINPDSPLTIMSLANCFSKQGNVGQFNHWFSLVSEPVFAGDEYARACFCALTQNRRAALKHLKNALKGRQIHPGWVQHDPFFDFMREGKDFQLLFQG